MSLARRTPEVCLIEHGNATINMFAAKGEQSELSR